MHVFISSKESVTAKVRINDICRLNVSLELGCTPDMGILCSEQFILYINYSVSCTMKKLIQFHRLCARLVFLFPNWRQSTARTSSVTHTWTSYYCSVGLLVPGQDQTEIELPSIK